MKLSFSFKPKIKERKTKISKVKSNNPPKPKNTILDKDITGTIILLHTYVNSDINAGYVFYVIIDEIDKIVPIDKDCYSCKGKKSVYRITEKGFAKYNRIGEGILEDLPKCFVPFKSGLKVLGNIIKNVNNEIVFKVKHIVNEL